MLGSFDHIIGIGLFAAFFTNMLMYYASIINSIANEYKNGKAKTHYGFFVGIAMKVIIWASVYMIIATLVIVIFKIIVVDVIMQKGAMGFGLGDASAGDAPSGNASTKGGNVSKGASAMASAIETVKDGKTMSAVSTLFNSATDGKANGALEGKTMSAVSSMINSVKDGKANVSGALDEKTMSAVSSMINSVKDGNVSGALDGILKDEKTMSVVSSLLDSVKDGKSNIALDGILKDENMMSAVSGLLDSVKDASGEPSLGILSSLLGIVYMVVGVFLTPQGKNLLIALFSSTFAVGLMYPWFVPRKTVLKNVHTHINTFLSALFFNMVVVLSIFALQL